MSTTGYADRLSPYEWKGKLSQPEVFDSPRVLKNKIATFAEWVKDARKIVFHTGAGISTSAGLPDFRGPKGVWTLEKQKKVPEGIRFEHALPTLTHMALVAMHRGGKCDFIVTQNVDNLHTKSGYPSDQLAELHGNIFMEICTKCGRKYVRDFDIQGCGLKSTGRYCVAEGCGGALRDNTLDWEDELPPEDLKRAEKESREADLCICLGTSLQINPSANIPFQCKRAKRKGKVVIVNLQATPKDKHADLLIHSYVDDVMTALCTALNLEIPPFPLYSKFVLSIGKTLKEKKNVTSEGGFGYENVAKVAVVAREENGKTTDGFDGGVVKEEEGTPANGAKQEVTRPLANQTTAFPVKESEFGLFVKSTDGGPLSLIESVEWVKPASGEGEVAIVVRGDIKDGGYVIHLQENVTEGLLKVAHVAVGGSVVGEMNLKIAMEGNREEGKKPDDGMISVDWSEARNPLCITLIEDHPREIYALVRTISYHMGSQHTPQPPQAKRRRVV
eukprot:comp17180_c0_seq1/m.16048 comp17180_c0_seq1/g.16048  ORF comp17180_c0_seq1/g.16048 comp17180_c0_seq1/m.16048 type:complete len:503 (-) comp17180_c0_seq1:33-1541(-)